MLQLPFNVGLALLSWEQQLFNGRLSRTTCVAQQQNCQKH